MRRWWASTTAEQLTVYISNAKRHWRKLGHHNITGLFAYCLSMDRSISGTNHSRGLGEIYTGFTQLKCMPRPGRLLSKRTRKCTQHEHRTSKSVSYRVVTRVTQLSTSQLRCYSYLTRPLHTHLLLCMIRTHLECTRIISFIMDRSYILTLQRWIN